VAAFVSLVVGCRASAPPVERESTGQGAEDITGRATPDETGGSGLSEQEALIQYLENLGFRKVYFDTDKWNIRDDAREALKKNAEIMGTDPDLTLTIEGHCDERNTVEYNLALGERRANSVRDYLIRLGVDGARLKTISYGEERPVSMGHDETAWQQNRRAEFKASK